MNECVVVFASVWFLGFSNSEQAGKKQKKKKIDLPLYAYVAPHNFLDKINLQSLLSITSFIIIFYSLHSSSNLTEVQSYCLLPLNVC